MLKRAYFRPLYYFAGITLFACAALGNAAPDRVNGMASYELLNEEQFIAALYLETPEGDPKRLLESDYPAQMEIRVTADRISRRKLVSLWMEGIAINNDSGRLAAQAEYLAQFSDVFKKSLFKNDRLTLTHRPSDGVEVNLNDVTLAVIPSSEFFPMLLSTWIGEVPLSSDFRAGILGKSDAGQSLRERYTAIAPSSQRRNEVAAWLAPKKVAAAPVAAPAPRVNRPVAVSRPEVKTQSETKPEPKTESKPEPRSQPEVAVAAKPSPAPVAAKKLPQPAPKGSEPKPAEPEPVQVALAQTDDEDVLESDGLDIQARKEDLLRRQEYYTQLVKHTHKFKTMPMLAFQRRLEGDVRLSVEIDRSGRVLSKTIIKSSRHKLFNEQALAAIDRAAPYPEIPPKISGDTYSFTVPMIYKHIR